MLVRYICTVRVLPKQTTVQPITIPNTGCANPLVPSAHAGHFLKDTVSVHAIGAPVRSLPTDSKLSLSSAFAAAMHMTEFCQDRGRN